MDRKAAATIIALAAAGILAAKSGPLMLGGLAAFAAGIGVSFFYIRRRSLALVSSLPALNGFVPARSAASLSQALKTLEYFSKEAGHIAARYELFTNNIAAAVTLYDRSRRILFCSPYTEVLTGYHLDEIRQHDGDLLAEIVVENDRDKYARAWGLAELGEDYSARYQIRHRDGFTMWFDTQFVPLIDAEGNVTSIMCVTVDVSELVNRRKQIEEQNQDLSDFSYMVSHDLKAPVFTIRGMATALLEDYGERLDQAGRELIGFILDGAGRLEKLIASVVEYSAISKKDAADGAVDLNAVVNAVLQDLSEQIKQAGAEVAIENSLPHVRGDQLRYYQVFSNLLGNALKYRAKERPLKIALRAYALPRDSAAVEVSDNGSGVPAEKIGDIFRPYHRAHGADIEGSGIGLACVKKIVEKAGGQVGVKSTEGEGSVFTVTLPLPPPKPQAVPEQLARAFEKER